MLFEKYDNIHSVNAQFHKWGDVEKSTSVRQNRQSANP